MHDPPSIGSRSRPESVEAVLAAIRAWEPRFEAYVADENPMIFEPETTLYAVCLSKSILRCRHRKVEVGPGDVLIVPAGVVVDADPGLDLFGLTHDGVPPYHFRERFIQSSGFEHVPSPVRIPGLVSMIPAEDMRYRTPATAAFAGPDAVALPVSPLGYQVWASTRGRGRLVSNGTESEVESGDIVGVPPGVAASLGGDLDAVGFLLLPEISYESLRADAERSRGPAWSPEPTPKDRA